MRLVKVSTHKDGPLIGLVEDDAIVPLSLSGGQFRSLTDILEADDPPAAVELLIDHRAKPLELARAELLAPIDRHEVWAAGVTYQRSKTARMEESEAAASCYDRVYEAARPELFFKANPHRVVGPKAAVRIRQDSAWNVPEPELALVLDSRLRLVGFTVGNDMSSRDIEGENPLYLPQAKVYDASCALGPCITLAELMPPPDEITIRLVVRRGESIAYQDETSIARMARSFDDLIDYLGRDNTFPDGVVLLTGTGIVPPADFTLHRGDLVEITIHGIGTLSNPVVQA